MQASLAWEGGTEGKVVVITGGTSGIGQVAATDLARAGARIIFIARDRSRASAALADVSGAGPGIPHRLVYANLASIAETRRAAAEIATTEPRIDVLINNAGALFNRRRLSPDGLEMTFAVNHMAYFVLTEGLTQTLVASAPSRIVNTASGAHRSATLDFDDLQSERGYSGFAVYGRSKLCNILFTRERARRLQGSGVTANCLHPGFVATRFGDGSGGLAQALMPIARLGAISPEKGAKTIVYLASSPEVASVSGLYFYQERPDTPSKAAQDDAAAARLWSESARLEANVAQAA
jgi:NAD(P)-dependent dehydrogenase (short-subunit alcohol dehydrogenase family)